MYIKLTPQQAVELKLAVGNNKDIARACLFLGYGLNETADILTNSNNFPSHVGILEAASALGMTDKDVIDVEQTGESSKTGLRRRSVDSNGFYQPSGVFRITTRRRRRDD